jgi:hypothetical protein
MWQTPANALHSQLIDIIRLAEMKTQLICRGEQAWTWAFGQLAIMRISETF